MDKKIKLMFCMKNLSYSGGIERVIANRITALLEEDSYEIIIVTTDQKKNEENFYKISNLVKIIHLEINYKDIQSEKFLYRVFKFKKKQKIHSKKMKEVLKEINPDIIMSLGFEDKWILPKIKGESKLILEHHSEKNHLLKLHNTIIYQLKDYYQLWKEKKMIGIYDKFLVLTQEDKKQWGDKRVEVIPNFLTFFPEEKAELENQKVISVGRLSYEKGYDMLIDIWNIVYQKHPKWILEIYGEGNEKVFLEKKIKNLNLENVIKLKGVTKNIKDKYLSSSIYIMSSRFEGFGMVLIEAMSCGLPVISFDCPCGPKDIIENNEDGFICKFNNIEDMAQKLIYLIENKEIRKRMGAKARENSLKFTKEKIIKEWKKIFETLKRKKDNSEGVI